MNIPECIFNKIMLYYSHPVADIVKANIEVIQLSGRNNHGSSTYADMFFNCKEHYFNECWKTKGSYLWLAKTKRKYISSGRYPYHLKHLTNEHIWNTR